MFLNGCFRCFHYYSKLFSCQLALGWVRRETVISSQFADSPRGSFTRDRTTLTYPKGKEIGDLFTVSLLPVFRCYHENDILFFVYLIKEPIFPYAIAPGFRGILFQFPDIFPQAGLVPEVRIYIIP